MAGVGNIFQSDDAFGVEVAARLAAIDLPPEVTVADFGIRGIHLAYELLEGYGTLILADAIRTGEPPGTVVVIEAEMVDDRAMLDAHSLDPRAVLSALADLGGDVGRVLVVGCEPATVEDGMGLSPAVAAAVGRAVEEIRSLVTSGPVSEGATSEREETRTCSVDW